MTAKTFSLTPFQQQEGVTAIIPAYNEADNIGNVLQVLQKVAAVRHLVVVDDASTDDTAAVVQTFAAEDRRISLVRQSQNGGKAAAMLAGAAVRRHDLLLFLDADLRGLEPYHVQNLIRPVRQGRYTMTVGLFADGRWKTNLTHHLFPFLSGQRCLRWSQFQNLYQKQLNGWSIETALSLHARAHKARFTYITWPGVTHAIRTEKRAGWGGYWSHIKMWWEIGQYTTHFVTHHLRSVRTSASCTNAISYRTIIK